MQRSRNWKGIRAESWGIFLGSYHMANPGLDGFNLEADDVLSPRRQNEIETLVEALANFRPTRVLVERPATSNGAQQWRASRHTAKRPWGRWGAGWRKDPQPHLEGAR